MFWLTCMWFIIRAFITVAFIYECYTVGLEIYRTVAGNGFTIPQMGYCAIKMWDKWEIGFFVIFFVFVFAIWII